MSRLSIVIPVYNARPYLKKCMEYLYAQTYQDWEVIFVDDGSTDGSGAILDKLIADEMRFQVVHQRNGGTARARNGGLERASGEYVTFMDCDDELNPKMYEKLVQLMDDTGADMGICGYYFKIEDAKGHGTYLEKKSYPSCFLKGWEQIRPQYIDLWDEDMLSNVWNKIYRMDLITSKNLRYRDGHVYTEDRVFNRQFLENCQSIAVTQDCLYYYVRERTGSTSEKYRGDAFTIRHKEYKEFQAHFKTLHMWDAVSREYVCREFTERVAGCIENIFHAERKLSGKEKRLRIQEMITHPDVIEAVSRAKCRSRKMRLLVFPIKHQSVGLTYMIYCVVYRIRKSNPALFHKLKGRR